MFDIEHIDIQNITISSETSWGTKKYNFPISYRLPLIEAGQNYYNVVNNTVFNANSYLMFLITSENFITPEKIKVILWGREYLLTDLDFFMTSFTVDENYNITYLEIYDLPSYDPSLSIKIEETITITEIKGFLKLDLENGDFSVYVESLSGNLRFLFC
jgi:hypothetical protein